MLITQQRSLAGIPTINSTLLSISAKLGQISPTWTSGLNGHLAHCRLRKTGHLNNAPAVEFLTEQIAGFPEGYKQRVVVSAVKVETGR